MFNRPNGAIILNLLGASASARIDVAGVSMRSAPGPRGGTERAALLIAG